MADLDAPCRGNARKVGRIRTLVAACSSGCLLVLCAAVKRVRTWLWYWLPVGIWMALIFTASSDQASSHRTSRIIAPVVRWLFPHWSEPRVDLAVLVVRKVAHFVEYSVLAVLVWRALWRPQRGDARPWSWRAAAWALAVVVAYAVSDEYHQTFVPNREGSPWDVLVDTVGAFCGLLGARWVYSVWHRRAGRAGAPAEKQALSGSVTPD